MHDAQRYEWLFIKLRQLPGVGRVVWCKTKIPGRMYLKMTFLPGFVLNEAHLNSLRAYVGTVGVVKANRNKGWVTVSFDKEEVVS